MNAKLEALNACDLVLSAPDISPATERAARLAIIDNLSPLADHGVPVAFHRIAFPVPEHLALCNPSIIHDDPRSCFRVVVRATNYRFTESGAYAFRSPGGFQSFNYLAVLDERLELRRVQPISDDRYRLSPPASYPVTGLEDLRLIRFRDQWWAVSSNPNVDDRPITQPVLVRIRNGELTKRRLLTSRNNTRMEKNWMPAVDPRTGHLHLVYSCSPTVVLRYHHKSATVEPARIHAAPLLARGLRGGSQVIPFDGGYLCLVHDFTVRDGEIKRTYFHRWLWFTRTWKVGKLSSPFYLRHHGVEFVAGLTRVRESFLISFGVNDAEAWLARVPVEHVRAMLKEPLSPGEARRQLKRVQRAFVRHRW